MGDRSVQFATDPERVSVGPGPRQEGWHESLAPIFEIRGVFREWKVCYLVFLFETAGAVFRDSCDVTHVTTRRRAIGTTARRTASTGCQ